MAEQAETAPERDDKDDHDLLTYGEAGVRLHEEIDALKKQLRVLIDEGDVQAQAKIQARLTVLEGARDRNSRQPINEENFEKFFGYKGVPKRNT